MAFLPGTGGRRFVSAALGLSSGVMVYVSLVDILPESIEKCAHFAYAGNLGYSGLFFRHGPDGVA